jgi:hypothetical protein
MSDPVARLNAALEGRYAIERELGEGRLCETYVASMLRALKKMKWGLPVPPPP